MLQKEGRERVEVFGFVGVLNKIGERFQQTPSCHDCLWSDQIHQMPGPQSVDSAGAARTNRLQCDHCFFLRNSRRLLYWLCWWRAHFEGDGRCLSLSAVTTPAVGVIILSSGVIILTTAVTSPTRGLDLITFLTSVVQGDGRHVSLGRTSRLSTMNVCLSANCAILVFMAAVRDWRLWGFDNEEFVVVASTPHQSPRFCVSRFLSAQSITIPLSVWSASISRHTEAESRSNIAGIGRSATKRRFDD